MASSGVRSRHLRFSAASLQHVSLRHLLEQLLGATKSLDRFGSLTDYKVNSSKSLILGISITPKLKQKLQSSYPFSWREPSIPYLGIYITKSVSRLIEANFPPLLKSIQLGWEELFCIK